MPSIAAHFVVAKKVSEKIEIESDDYFLGNILPDIIDDTNSHHKVKGKYYFIPNMDKFLTNNNFSKDIFLGYATHLLLDKYFLEEYVPGNVKDFDKIKLFSHDKIYKDYTSMNYELVKKYNLDVDNINRIMDKDKTLYNENKYRTNRECLNRQVTGKLNYIDFSSFCKFLEEISDKISEDIKRWC